MCLHNKRLDGLEERARLFFMYSIGDFSSMVVVVAAATTTTAKRRRSWELEKVEDFTSQILHH